MLRIIIEDTPSERKWILSGRLAGPWVKEVKSSWKMSKDTRERQTHIVDLREVTFVDKSGERLLETMIRNGVQVIAKGLLTRHVVERLVRKNRRELGKFLGCLLASVFLFSPGQSVVGEAPCPVTVILRDAVAVAPRSNAQVPNVALARTVSATRQAGLAGSGTNGRDQL